MILGKKDICLLQDVGFSDADLGLIEGGKRGVEMYETPQDYFANELIQNACEQGLCSIWDDSPTPVRKEPYDTSRKMLWEDDPYPGLDDPMIDVDQCLRPQVEWLQSIKIGRMSLWQKRSDYGFKWVVKYLTIDIPNKGDHYKLTKEEQSLIFKRLVAKEWKKLWMICIDSLYQFHVDKTEISTKKGPQNLIIIDAKDINSLGYKLPGEVKWITMLYFPKTKWRTKGAF